MEPNSTLTPASDPTVPVPLCVVVKTERNRAPSPSTQAKTLPITVSSAVARRPSAASSDGEAHARPVEAGPQVDAEGQGGERPGEGHVREGVGREHLAPEHHHVADQPRRQGDAGPGGERRAQERVVQHVGQAGERIDGPGQVPGRRHPPTAAVGAGPCRPPGPPGRPRCPGTEPVAQGPAARGQHVDPEPDGGHVEAHRVDGVEGHQQRHPGDDQRQHHGEGQAEGGPGGDLLGGGGRHDQQGEDQQGPGDLADLGGRASEQQQEHQPTAPGPGRRGPPPRRRRRWRTAAGGR